MKFMLVIILCAVIVSSCNCYCEEPLSFHGIITNDLENGTLRFYDSEIGKKYTKSFLIFTDNNENDEDIIVKSIDLGSNEKGSFKILFSPQTPLVLKAGGKNKPKIEIEFSPIKKGVTMGSVSIIIARSKGQVLNYFVSIHGTTPLPGKLIK